MGSNPISLMCVSRMGLEEYLQKRTNVLFLSYPVIMLDFMYAYSLSSTGGYGFINDYTLSPFKIIQNIYFIVPQMRLALINIIDKTTFIILYLMHIVIFHCTCY